MHDTNLWPSVPNAARRTRTHARVARTARTCALPASFFFFTFFRKVEVRSGGGSACVLEGWLFKLSGEVGAGLHRKWDKRYFRLKDKKGDRTLQYFRDSNPDTVRQWCIRCTGSF